MKRREVLSLMSLLGANALLQTLPGLQLFANAQANPGVPLKKFVLVRMPQGWDVVMGLDPFVRLPDGCDESDLTIGYDESQVFRSGSIIAGPTLTPMTRYLSRAVIVNGVFMSESDVGHESNLSLISSGISGDMAGSIAVELASSMPKGAADLLVGAKSNGLQLGGRAIVPMTDTDIVNFAENPTDLKAFSFLSKMGIRSRLLEAQKRLVAGQPQFQSFKNLRHEVITRFALDTAQESDNVAATLAAAFATGCAAHAQVDLQLDLDTHSNHVSRQMPAQKEGWQRLATLLRIFEGIPLGRSGESLLDHTTFLVVSDFSRTPYLNGAKGKDHNPLTNSVMMLGQGIRGGQVIGGSRVISRRKSPGGLSRHVARAYNFDENRVAQNDNETRSNEFNLITPDVVIATVAAAVGVRPEKFYAFDLNGVPILGSAVHGYSG